MKLNKLNIDGSVNSYIDVGVPGHGYYAPFNISNFEDQIEKDIFPAVFILNANGFKTYTSCQGHSLYSYIFGKGLRFNFGPQITLEINKTEFDKIKKAFTNFFVFAKINSTIPLTDTNIVYISVKPKFFINLFFSNKFICKKIYNLSKTAIL